MASSRTSPCWSMQIASASSGVSALSAGVTGALTRSVKISALVAACRTGSKRSRP